jgi:hypothetical protein
MDRGRAVACHLGVPKGYERDRTRHTAADSSEHQQPTGSAVVLPSVTCLIGNCLPVGGLGLPPKMLVIRRMNVDLPQPANSQCATLQ